MTSEMDKGKNQYQQQTKEDLICPNCGVNKENWSGDNGRGYRKNGQSYCCQDCAEDTGECTCAE